MTILRTFFEFLPVAMAVVAIIGLVSVYNNPRRMIDQWIVTVSVVSCTLLVIAQGNWIQSLFAGLDTGSPFVEYVWTVFNTSVTFNCLLLVWSHLPRRQ